MQICLKKVRAGEVRTKLLDPKLTENMVGKYFWIPGIMVAWEVYFHLKVENLNNKTGDSTSCVQVDNDNKIKALIKIHPSIVLTKIFSSAFPMQDLPSCLGSPGLFKVETFSNIFSKNPLTKVILNS